jgi:hypothetical protein
MCQPDFIPDVPDGIHLLKLQNGPQSQTRWLSRDLDNASANSNLSVGASGVWRYEGRSSQPIDRMGLSVGAHHLADVRAKYLKGSQNFV